MLTHLCGCGTEENLQ